MRFVPAHCPTCGLTFTVILSGGQRTAQADRATWESLCPRTGEAAEPRLCLDFRATVFAILGENEKPIVIGRPPRVSPNFIPKPKDGDEKAD